MPSSTIEDYLKTVFLQQQRAGGGLVPMGVLAETMGVVPGTATAMVKRLARLRLLSYRPYAGVQLTAKGRKLALQVLRRHRLLETFLVEALGLDWSEVHEEAERLEHALSDKLLDRIDAFLGRPAVDPHGDPIPDREGTLRATVATKLSECADGESVTVARVLDQDEAFLQFIDESGLRPGTRMTVQQHDDAGDSITVRSGRKAPVTMGTSAAAKLLVERE